MFFIQVLYLTIIEENESTFVTEEEYNAALEEQNIN